MTTPKTSSPELMSSQASKELTANEAFRRIEAGAGLFRVEDNDAVSPLGSCADGAQYLVAGSPTGAWSGHATHIAIAVGPNASNGWYFITPEEGMIARIKDENAWSYFDGSAWQSLVLGGGDMLAANNLSDLVSASTARTNLGLGSAAVLSTSDVDERARDAVGTALVAGNGMSVTVDDAGDTVTLKSVGVGVSSQTGTSYTAVLPDANTYIRHSNASAITFTIPPNSSVAFPVGTVIEMEQAGAGALSVAAGSGVTINSRSSDLTLAGQYAVAFVKKVATDTWTMNGDL